jgi:ElaB/YqjD/DUF883 family membrane-anchored ribosome-binding protein
MDTTQLESKVRNFEAQMEDQLSEVKQKLRTFSGQAADFIRERPGTAIAGAFVVGYLIARMARR